MSDLMFDRPDWQADAACRGVDTDLFFPTRPEGTGTGGEMEAAKEVCRGCHLAALHVKRPNLLQQVAATVRWSPAPWVRIAPPAVTGVYAPRDDGAVYLSTAVAS